MTNPELQSQLWTLLESESEELMEKHKEGAFVALISVCMTQGYLNPGDGEL